MAEPTRPNKPNNAGAAPPAAPPAEQPKTPESGPSSADYNAMKRELDALKESNRKVTLAVRKLAAGILTPKGLNDDGQARRNTINQALQEIFREFGFDSEE